MAIDSRSKRLSILNFSMGDLLPDPATAGVDASERATFLDLYSGIELSGVVAPTAYRRIITTTVLNRIDNPLGFLRWT